MTPGEVLDISREAVWVLLKISLPILLISLVVGLVVSFFQALTQIQEMTLSFIPKIVVFFISLLFLLPFIGQSLGSLGEHLFMKMASLGG